MDFNLSPLNKLVIKAAREFCEREIPKIDAYMKEHKDYPPNLQEIFAEHKMLGMDVPKEYGGIGADNFNLILIAEEVGKTGTTCMLPFFMNNSVAETICHWGTEEVIKKFVPPLCDGSAWASMAFTEPNTGSDPRMLTMTAEPDGDDFILNGTKRFISMANKPGYGIFFCKDLSMKGKPYDTTAFVVDKMSPGITFSGHYELMGLDGADTCDVFFKDVRVPKANILGKQGKGFPILLRWIAGERVQQCAATIGGGQAALEESVKYGNERVVGGFPMGFMQGFAWMLADMKTKVEACRLMCHKTVQLQDQKVKGFEALSSELKVFTVPMIQDVCKQAVQFHGSYGYSKEYKVEKLFRNAMHAGVVASSLEINKTIAGMTILTQK